ncbi:MAG TPA: M13 family metallopeptidase [Opitutaceae bacterium]|nr:M13 family metallopeptidase [Opitutaceae bacterium]
MRTLILAAAAASLTLGVRAEINPKNFDPSVKPQSDFYQYADGGWIKANPIPPEYSSWGAFNELAERNRTELHTVLEDSLHATNPSPIEKMVGDFYASGMDSAAIDAAGIKPLLPELARIDQIRTPADVQAEIAHLHTLQINVGFVFGSEQDPKNSTMMIAAGGQGGLGLPDRDYYLRTDPKSQKIRDEYVAHVTRILQLAGESETAAKADAASVMQLETVLARGSKARVDLRDPVANYHKLPIAEIQKLTPQWNWNEYFRAIGLADPGAVDIGQPEFFQVLAQQLTQTPVAAWRAYLRWHLLHGSARFLSTPFVNENFAFYGTTLTGTPKLLERWKRVLSTIDGGIGEALGQLYVQRYFPPASKARVLKLVDDLRAALHDRLETISWMDEPTRKAALHKLDAFGVKIGYPDKWIDYSKLTIDRGSYLMNVFRASTFDFNRDLAKIGKPVDRTEWGMTPPTVNAYYNPTMNEIVFPAGILQPPFFDAKADDAANYGAIGTVIGHEMTHGFDDEGRQFDAQGNLTDWWTPESAARFKKLAAGIVQQFNGYKPFADMHVNGELTQGENIADLGGVKIAYAAFEKAMAGKPRTTIGGFTPEQRFFLSYANEWRSNIRPEQERLYLTTDPHSPARYRVDGPLSNLDQFAQAFHVPEGAPMRRPKSEQVVIW